MILKEKKKILIVEDEAIIKALKDKFEKEGFEVEIAQDGGMVIEALNRSRPDLVLLDILLPKMNGLELLQKIKGDAMLKDIPIIVFSNLNEPSYIEKAKSFGILEYIAKTEVTIHQLVERVNIYLK